MADASYVQSSFLGGEWSPLMQGRIDLPKYRMALNLCLNGIPVEEGAWVRRSGTQFLGPTYHGETGRVIGYEYQENDPALLELTAGFSPFAGVMRVWNLGAILTDSSATVTNISADSSPIFTVAGTPPWLTGRSVVFSFSGAGSPYIYAGLQNRQFEITMLTASTFTCMDAATGVPLAQAELNAGAGGQTITANRIVEITTPWLGTTWETCRFISLGQGNNGLQGVMLNGATSPQTITVTNPGAAPTVAMAPTLFRDGPYLDPVPDAQLNFITSTQTTLSYRLFGGAAWSPATGADQGRYNTGDLVTYQGFAYVSTIGGNSGSNTGNVPGNSTAWVLVNPSITGTAPNYNLATWSAGGSYTPWNGTGNGSTIVFGGVVYIAVNRLLTNFSGNGGTPGSSQNWAPMSVILENQSISGIVGYEVSFQPWNTATTYTTGDSVTYNAVNYTSLVTGNLGNEPDISPSDWVIVSNGAAVDGKNGLVAADVGRMVRLFYAPQTWLSAVTYQPGVYVTYNGAYYQAQDQTTGQVPNVSPTVWTPVSGPAVAFWTWGQITSVQFPNVFQMEILGLPLTDSTPISVVQFGVYTNSGPTWPTVGLFYQGRLWLMGAVPNRADASQSDDPFNFAPTQPDGTVQDNNGISITFLSEDNELIQWAKGSTQGILIGTLTHERLIQASTLQEPLTPASTEEAPVTHYGGAFIAAIDAGLATLFVQRHGRQVMEMVTNVFSGKYNAPNLALTAKHLTATNVEELAYQEELTPTIWARTGSGQLIGCTYRRVTAFQTDNPALVNEPSTFAAWHQHQLGTGRTVTSITNTFIPDGSLPTVAMITSGNWVEILRPLFEVGDTIYDAWFVDGSDVPTSAQTVNDGTRFFGFNYQLGNTVSVWSGGLDCGDFLVQVGGYVDVPFGSAGGLYTAAYLNGLVASGYDGVTNMVLLDGVIPIPAVVGKTYTSSGQIVRPASPADTGARNGPGQGKTRRNHMMTALLNGTQGISFGTDFQHVYPFQPALYVDGPVYPVTELYSGVYWATIDSTYDFDGMVCWTVGRPYPASVVNIGGFIQTQDR